MVEGDKDTFRPLAMSCFAGTWGIPRTCVLIACRIWSLAFFISIGKNLYKKFRLKKNTNCLLKDHPGLDNGSEKEEAKATPRGSSRCETLHNDRFLGLKVLLGSSSFSKCKGMPKIALAPGTLRRAQKVDSSSSISTAIQNQNSAVGFGDSL